MAIPIENIYFLLSYAWNKLEEKNRVQVSTDDKTQVLDLLAKVLVTATQRILKRGIDKNYIDHTEEMASIKGKIELSQTIKKKLLCKQRAICTYNDLSSNIITNQIVVSTLYRLSRTQGLDSTLVKDVLRLQNMFLGVDVIHLNQRDFSKFKLNRNNRFYGFLLDVCYLIFINTLPAENPGYFTFSDFTRDERKMNQLFEAFLRNFYQIEQKDYSSVKREDITWQFAPQDHQSNLYLPKMQTDVTLESVTQKIIIDAKFYKETMLLHYDKEKVRSDHLYQLFSYLLNQEDGSDKTLNATGILLYPTTEKAYKADFRYNNHFIKIRTVNLNAHWQEITHNLLSLIKED